MRDCVLALDIGSSSIRGAVFDASAALLQIAHRTYPDRAGRVAGGIFPATNVADLLRQILRELDLESVGIVSISSLWHSLVGIDDSGAPETDVYTWEATAPDAALDGLAERLEPVGYRHRTGSYLHASYPVAAYWYLRSRGTESARWSDLPGWLAREVLGVDGGWSVDIASGSGMWNQAEARWDEETCTAIDLDPSRLGPIWSTAQEVGARASEFGLRGAVVLPPFGDGACNSVGIGATGPAVSALTVGTSGSLRMLVDAQVDETPFGLWRYRLQSGTAIGGAISNAGNLLEWLGRSLGVGDPLAFATNDPPRFDGLLAQPHLAGERGPSYARGATGELTGLRLHHSAADISNAFVMSILVTYRRLTQLMTETVPSLAQLVASGGVVTAGPAFAQLLADATERPVIISHTDESSLLGAALLALGITAPLPEGTALVPRPDWSRAFSERAAVASRAVSGE